MTDAATLPALEAFPTRVVQTLRYGDMDEAGHVNNAVYSTLFEAGRVALLYDPARDMPPAGCHFSLVRITIDFLAEMSWPGDVTIATGATRLGSSSIGLRQAIFKDGVIQAHNDSVVVLTNSSTRRSQPMPDYMRAMFEALRMPEEA